MGNTAEMSMKMKASDAGIWSADMGRAKAEGTIPEDAVTDEVRRLVLEGVFTYSVSTPGHLQLEFNLVHKVLPYFHGRKWILYYARKSNQTNFVTSDNPVSLMWRNRMEPAAPGLCRLGTKIIFSVSNELAMKGTFEGKPGVVDADDEIVAIINGNISPFVTRQVYGRGADFLYATPYNDRTMRGSELLEDPVSRL